MNRKLPDTRWETFLSALSTSANVTLSAAQAGVSRAVAYKRRSKDPEFAKLWDEAVEEALDLLEAEVQRRAFQGVDEPVYYQGEVKGHVKKYSDTLAMFLLRAYRPQKFGQGPVNRMSFNLTASSGNVQAQLKADIDDYSQLRSAANDVRQIIEGECEPVPADS